VATIICARDGASLVEQAKRAFDASTEDIVVVTENGCSPDAALELLLGRSPYLDSVSPLGTPARLDGLLIPLGLHPVGNVVLPAKAPARAAGGLIELLDDVARRAGLPGQTPVLARRYERQPDSHVQDVTTDGSDPTPTPPPALSVLVRTQGRRPQALADSLLSLAGQTCSDFEVILLCHRALEEDLDGVHRLVSSFGRDFREQIRVVVVTGEGRAAPLNAGVAAARGRHIAFLDDDDVALGNWVETFVSLASTSPRSVLRARVCEQSMERAGPLEPGFRASSQVRSPWNADFDLLDHWVDNHSPINGYAYPVFAFRDLGFRFDTALPVLEDWSLLLQVASTCGVVSSPEFTAIYRRWPAPETSFAELPEEQWQAVREQILAELDAHPWIVPPGLVSRAREAELIRLTSRPFKVRLYGWLGRKLDVVRHWVAKTPFGPPSRTVVRWLLARRRDAASAPTDPPGADAAAGR
jgi:hypothetical protein